MDAQKSFEAWAALGDVGAGSRLDLATHHGVYMDQDTRCAWAAWQARAALDRPSDKPVAWMTEDGRVAMDSTKNCMPQASRVSFNIPLFKSDRSSHAELSDEQILQIAAQHEFGWGSPYGVQPFHQNEADAGYVLAFARAIASVASDHPSDVKEPK